MVTAASLASMGVSALSTFVLPIIILVVARRRWGCSLWSAAVGALVFVVFALLLEGGLHALVFTAIPNLPSKPMLYTIHAALAAGVFEELGRVCGFAVLQASDRRPDGVGRALGAGIGHGGIEAILLVGVATISHLVISVSVINAGTSEAFLAGLSDAQRDIVARQFELLINTPAPFYLLSIGERTIAMCLAHRPVSHDLDGVRREDPPLVDPRSDPRSRPGRCWGRAVSERGGERRRGAGVGIDRHCHSCTDGEANVCVHHSAARSRSSADIVNGRRVEVCPITRQCCAHGRR